MGAPTPESKKKTDRLRQQRLDDARRRGVRESQKLRDQARGADVPKGSSTLDKTVNVTGLVVEVLGHAAEGTALEFAGPVATAITSTREVVKAIGETHEANARQATATGVGHAVSAMAVDLKNPNSPRIRDGKPWSKAQLADSTKVLKAGFDRDAFIRVENRNAENQYLDGRALARKGFNDALRDCKTPEERKVAAHAFTKTLGDSLAQSAQQWRQHEQQREQQIQQRNQRFMQ